MSISSKFLLVLMVIICTVFNSLLANSKSKSDSLLSIISDPFESDSVKSKVYSDLSRHFLKVNSDSAFYFGERGLQLSKRINYDRGIAWNYYALGRVEDLKSGPKKAIQMYELAVSHFLGLNDIGILYTYIYLGMDYEKKQDYDKAIQSYNNGILESKKQANNDLLAQFYNNIAIIYELTGFFDEAIDYYTRASVLFRDINQYYYANSLVNLGALYRTYSKFDSAELFYKKALPIQQELKNFYGLANLYSGLGSIRYMKSDYEYSQQYYLNAYMMIDSIDPNHPDRVYLTANVTNMLGNNMLRRNNPEKAIIYYMIAIEFAKFEESLALKDEIYHGLYQAYIDSGEVDKALEYMNLYIAVHDSLIREIHNERIAELNYEHKLQTERSHMEQERELIIADRKNQRLTFLIVIGALGTLVIVLILIGYIQKSRINQSKLRQKNLELEKRQLQIDLDYKNKELTTSVLHLIERNEFINQLSEKLQATEEKLETESILDLVRDIEQNTSGNLWKEFEKTYMEVHKDFHIALTSRYPQLTANDRKLCAFILMNMSTKEISSITYQSPQSIKIARYRLRKKLGLQRSDNLSAFLNQLESGTTPTS